MSPIGIQNARLDEETGEIYFYRDPMPTRPQPLAEFVPLDLLHLPGNPQARNPDANLT